MNDEAPQHRTLPTNGGDGPAPGVDLGDYGMLKQLIEEDGDAGPSDLGA